MRPSQPSSRALADLVADGGQRAAAGPAVRGELDHPQLLSRLELARHGGAQPVGVALGGDGVLAGRVDEVLHRRGHPQAARLGGVHEQAAGALLQHLLGLQRVVQHRGDARVLAGRRELLVGDELGLQDQPGGGVDRLHLVEERDDGALGERHHAHGPYPDRLAGGRHPLHDPLQRARPQVERALVGPQLAVAHVERLVVHEQAHELGVGDVHHRLARLREAVPGLGVGQRPQLVERVEVGAGQAVRLALVQVPADADVAVGQGEDRLGLGQEIKVQPGFPDVPGVDGVGPFTDHGGASRN